MKFVITNAKNPNAGAPLWVTGRKENGAPEVRGVCETNELRFDTRDEAQAYLATLTPRAVDFYGLEVQPETAGRPQVGGNGWMVGHPGYDLH